MCGIFAVIDKPIDIADNARNVLNKTKQATRDKIQMRKIKEKTHIWLLTGRKIIQMIHKITGYLIIIT